MKKSTVRVYDTISKEYVDIEVSEEVDTYYNIPTRLSSLCP